MMETNWYRKIPKLDLFMETDDMKKLADSYGYPAVLEAARQAEEEVRGKLRALESQERRNSQEAQEQQSSQEMREQQSSQEMQEQQNSQGLRERKTQQERQILQEQSTLQGVRILRERELQTLRNPQELLDRLPARVREILCRRDQKRMQRVINATGVILHTNLGRAPLNRELAGELADLMAGYSNLEYDLETGERGSRYSHFEEAVCRLTGAEAALAVNNNAGAVLVMLAALTAGREAIVSRGELVEIGGKFRVPEVMEQSGTQLTEVGTTNRTYIQDYENAVNENTAAFLKVHTSNYQISGFTCAVSVKELAALGAEKGIPVLVDLGSGSLVEFKDTEFTEGAGEPTVRKILEEGADLVAFSGDKLLGGPQAGILAGKKELIQKISSHPLMRALRIDKFTAAALDGTFAVYERQQEWEKIPVLEMMSRPVSRLEEMAEELLEGLKRDSCGSKAGRGSSVNSIEADKNRSAGGLEADRNDGVSNSRIDEKGSKSKDRRYAKYEIVRTTTPTGGGSLPGRKLPGVALSIMVPGLSADELQRRLRTLTPPVIARIEDGRILLEMRTIFPEEIPLLVIILPEVF